MSFTMKDITAAVSSSLSEVSSHSGLTFSYRSDVQEEIRAALEGNNSTAPEVIYYSDGWDVVAGSEFNSYDPKELIDGFEGCESATDCVMREANALASLAYDAEIAEAMDNIAAAVQEVFDLGGADFPGAESCCVSEVKAVSGCALGHVPHDFEYDLNTSGASSVCVWLGEYKTLYFSIHGMSFTAVLEENE